MDISLDSIKPQITGIFRRYHVIIFVIVAVGGLIFVMFRLNGIIQSSSSSSVTPPQPASFDKTTMNDIRELRGSDQTSSKLKLSGRSNPFVE